MSEFDDAAGAAKEALAAFPAAVDAMRPLLEAVGRYNAATTPDLVQAAKAAGSGKAGVLTARLVVDEVVAEVVAVAADDRRAIPYRRPTEALSGFVAAAAGA